MLSGDDFAASALVLGVAQQVPVARAARTRKYRSTPSPQCSAPALSQAHPQIAGRRSCGLRLATAALAGNGERHHHHPTRDGPSLALHGIQVLVALETPELGRASPDRAGASRADPAHSVGKSTMGRPRASTGSCSSSASRSPNPRCRSTCQDTAGLPRRDGGPSCAIMPTPSPRLIFSLFPLSTSRSSMS